MTKLEVLGCDNHVLAVNKPACVPAVPDESGDESLFDQARRYIEVEYQKPGRAFLGVVQRLDRPVSGVIVFARTSKAASRLTDALRARRLEKVYWAITEGAPDGESGEVVHHVAKDVANRRVAIVRPTEAGAKEAVTHWRVLRRYEDEGLRAFVELRPRTGRKHQLRVALSSIGTPILGDLKYGARDPLADRSIALHARRLSGARPVGTGEFEFVAEVPERNWWRRAVR